jgi:hypothetical protein
MASGCYRGPAAPRTRRSCRRAGLALAVALGALAVAAAAGSTPNSNSRTAPSSGAADYAWPHELKLEATVTTQRSDEGGTLNETAHITATYLYGNTGANTYFYELQQAGGTLSFDDLWCDTRCAYPAAYRCRYSGQDQIPFSGGGIALAGSRIDWNLTIQKGHEAAVTTQCQGGSPGSTPPPKLQPDLYGVSGGVYGIKPLPAYWPGQLSGTTREGSQGEVVVSWTLSGSVAGQCGSPRRTATARVRAARLGRAAAAPPCWTVSGGIPFPHKTSRDSDQATGSPALAKTCSAFTNARYRGFALAAIAFLSGARDPYAADALHQWLNGRTSPLEFRADSAIAKEAKVFHTFTELNAAIKQELKRRLDAGDRTVVVHPRQTVDFTTAPKLSELYVLFRGTQGLDISGEGTITGGRYQGKLTYVIRDTFGFSNKDLFSVPGGKDIGRDLHYLQTVCGGPYHPGGAHWYPDSVTVEVPVDLPAAP